MFLQTNIDRKISEKPFQVVEEWLKLYVCIYIYIYIYILYIYIKID